jgi:mannose-6-phosphate isomerase-like protein (cupin superfamily)
MKKESPISKASAAVSSTSAGGRSRVSAVSKYQPLKHYQWGSDCDGWNLVDEDSLSVKQELMPSGAKEVKHVHQKAQQFFYILKGKATFEIEDSTIELNEGEGLHIEAGAKHRIINNSKEDLEFILCSQPSTKDDRINCE